jgi:uncharacterized pyridoxamine 5'-phosphate oxidase family protein
MNEVYEYLKKCGAFYLATTDGNQPRVRPFGALDIFEGKIYIQTGNVKKVFKQMKINPKIEICGMADKETWIRIEASAIPDDRIEARQHMLDANPRLKSRYSADDGILKYCTLKMQLQQYHHLQQSQRSSSFNQ